MTSVSITPENVSGLVVGEGCFYCESAPDQSYRLGWRLRPGFCIEMRADELPVLEQVRSIVGCGDIYHLDFGRYRGYESKGWKPHVKYRVTRIGDLAGDVVPFFERYPLFGRKAQAFQTFSELVGVVAKRAHLTPEGLTKGVALAKDLAAHNGRGKSRRTDRADHQHV